MLGKCSEYLEVAQAGLEFTISVFTLNAAFTGGSCHTQLAHHNVEVDVSFQMEILQITQTSSFPSC